MEGLSALPAGGAAASRAVACRLTHVAHSNSALLLSQGGQGRGAGRGGRGGGGGGEGSEQNAWVASGCPVRGTDGWTQYQVRGAAEPSALHCSKKGVRVRLRCGCRYGSRVRGGCAVTRAALLCPSTPSQTEGGEKYYHHGETGETQWEAPEGWQGAP